MCVTVAMMTTGYDCPDLLNLGFCRPVKSPIDYIQMKGRGTRLYEFTNNFTDQVVRDQLALRPKESFRIIDYFGVCEYFNEEGLYGDEPLKLPQNFLDGSSGSSSRTGVTRQAFIRYGEDQTESITELSMDAGGAITSRSDILEQREAVNLALAEEFERYLDLHPVANNFEREDVQRLFEAYLVDESTRLAIDSGQFSALGGPITIQQYSRVPQEHREAVPEYVKDLNWQVEQS